MVEMKFSLTKYIIHDFITKETIIKHSMYFPEQIEIERLLNQKERYELISKENEEVKLDELPTWYLDELIKKASDNQNNAIVLTEIHRIISMREGK